MILLLSLHKTKNDVSIVHQASNCDPPPSVEFIHSFIHSSMTRQPVIGPWPLLQFRNFFYTVGRTPLTGDQPVARPLPTHRINAYTDIHALSGIRIHDPTVRASEDSSCLRPRGHRDQPSVGQRSYISRQFLEGSPHILLTSLNTLTSCASYVMRLKFSRLESSISGLPI
jgi:hypothetical protein